MGVRVVVDDRDLLEIIRRVERLGQPVYIVADGVEYGIFQELGTRFVPARHFMRDACRAVESWFASQPAWEELILHGDDQALRLAAFQVEGEAKLRAPVDTGALRASIHVAKAELFEYEIPGRKG